MFWFSRHRRDDLLPLSTQAADLSGALNGLQAIVGALLGAMPEANQRLVFGNLKKLLAEGSPVEPIWLRKEDRDIFKNSFAQMIFSLLEVHDNKQPPQSN
jgi:hypothetical protein